MSRLRLAARIALACARARWYAFAVLCIIAGAFAAVAT
jgi:hypothetical protein